MITKTKEKRLLYVSTRIFWPPYGGHESEMYHYSRGLSEQLGYQVDVYVFAQPDDADLRTMPSFIHSIYACERISAARKIWNLFSKSFLCRKKWPLQCSLFYSPENVRAIRKLLAEGDYDALLVDMVRLAPYIDACRQYTGCKVLDIDDMLSKRYERQASAIDKKTNIAGQYAAILPSGIQKVLGLSWLKRMILRLEIPRMRWAEAHYANRYDKVIFVSPLETKAFNAAYHTDKAVNVGIGVDYNYFSENLGIEKEPGTIAFLGNMGTAANADTLRMIVREILPRCQRVKKFYVIGNCPTELQKELGHSPLLYFTGKVEDIRFSAKKCQVFLAPLAYGTGIKTKILEAMAMGMPVITNRVGAEGIAAESGREFFVEDDYAALAAQVDSLLERPDLCERTGKLAQAYTEKNCQWERIWLDFHKAGL